MIDSERIRSCVGVEEPCDNPATYRRQSTRYEDEDRNWIHVCDACFKEIENHWEECMREAAGFYHVY